MAASKREGETQAEGDLNSFDPEVWPRKLNVGCGWDKRPGYLNVDFIEGHHPDLIADFRILSMLPTAYYDELVAQDVLEHVKREDAPRTLREWSRVLRTGGVLVMRVPNLLGLAYLMSVRTSIEEQRELVRCMFGTQAYEGDFHLNGYTEILLRHELRSAGFGRVVLEPFHEWLFEVTALKGPPDRVFRLADCIFMTTEKPSLVARRRYGGSSPGKVDQRKPGPCAG